MKALAEWVELLECLEVWGTDEALTKAVTEATKLRESVKSEFDLADGPEEMHKQLIKHRKAQDRLEFLLANLARAKAKLDQAVTQVQHVIDDAETEAVGDKRNTEDFRSGPERNAALRLAGLEQRVTLRQLEKRKQDIAAVLDYVRTLYRGLDASRQDLNTRIRLISISTTLER